MNKLILTTILLTVCTIFKTQSEREFTAFSWGKASIDSVNTCVFMEYKNMVYDGWNKMRPELNLTKSEMLKLNCHTFAYYSIDSLSMVKMNEKTDLFSVLKLNKNYMYCLYSKNIDFLFSALMFRKKGTWESIYYGLIPKDLSLYNEFINNQKKQVIYVMVESMDFDILAYIENGEYWVVSKDKTRLKEELLMRFHTK